MRAYFFTNMYLSSLQQGIQSGHCITEMFIKYKPYHEFCSDLTNMLYDWAENHKTSILLNGGFHETIAELTSFFADEQNPYPWARFFEGVDAMNGMQTTVGIILPETIYTTATLLREKCGWYENTDGTNTITPPRYDEPYVVSKWEFHLAAKLNTFKLAQ